MKALLEQNEEQQEEQKDYYDVLRVPYIAGFSEQLPWDAKPIHIGLTFQQGKTIYNSACKLKPLKRPNDTNNVIYCLGCKSCKEHFLGEIPFFSHSNISATTCSKI